MTIVCFYCMTIESRDKTVFCKCQYFLQSQAMKAKTGNNVLSILLIFMFIIFGHSLCLHIDSIFIEQLSGEVNTMDITVKRREAFDLYSHRFSGPPENHLHLLFSDRVYNARSPMTVLKACLVEKLSGRNNPLHRIVLDVISEFREIVQIEEISHLVLHGNNRARVLVDIVCCDCMPQSIPIVLSKEEIVKEEHIAQNPSFGGLIRPYQIDTDRYPFQNQF